jgi:hypothetical protein
LVEVLPVPLSPKARRIIFEPGTVRSGDGYAELIDHAPGTVLNLENADAGQSDFVAVLEMAVVTIRVIVRNLLRPPNAGPA